jgi:hypothetical protein
MYVPDSQALSPFGISCSCSAARAIIWKRNIAEGQMKLARIAAPFGLSAVLFILAYLSSKDTGSGYFPVMLMGIGLVLAIVGIAAVFSSK